LSFRRGKISTFSIQFSVQRGEFQEVGSRFHVVCPVSLGPSEWKYIISS
jgi:hypothetical protein